MSMEEDKEQDAAEEEDEEIEEDEDEVEEEAEDEEEVEEEAEDEEEVEEEAEDDEEELLGAPAPAGGPTWGFWRMLFALLIIAVVAVAGWLGWQHMVAQRERAQEAQQREAETKQHLLLVSEKLRSAEECAARADLDGMLDDLGSASEALDLALSITIEEMRPSLEGLADKLRSARDDVEKRQQRLRVEAEKEAKAAAEAVSAALGLADSITGQRYMPAEGG